MLQDLLWELAQKLGFGLFELFLSKYPRIQKLTKRAFPVLRFTQFFTSITSVATDEKAKALLSIPKMSKRTISFRHVDTFPKYFIGR